MRVIGILVALLVLSGCLGTPQTPAIVDASVVAGTVDSETSVEEIPASDVAKETSENDENQAEAANPPTPQKVRRGLFGLFGRNKADAAGETLTEESAVAGPVPETVQEPVKEEIAQGGDDVVEDPQAETSDRPRRGLFGIFGSKRSHANPKEPAEVDSDATDDEKPVVDVKQTDVTTIETETPRKPRRGLFGPRRSDRPDSVIEPGTVLPFGEIGVVCGLRGQAMGKEVDRFPAKGKGYRLYDSNPSSTLPRTHYLTGFKDGCARQFTASLVLIGSPVLHEQMRYDPSNKDIPVTEADKAYERIKRRICKVAKGEPCPEKHVAALEKGMAFVTLYERFGSNASWEEVLLHNGQIAGTSLRKR
ncbi:hypothetical protein [Profundibacter sp.]